MIDDLKHIWKTCFDDNDEYIDFYFSNRYKPENTLVHYESGRVVAMLTLLPVSVATPFGILQSHYVYAVATLPEFRGKGISSALAAKADDYMRIAGDDLALVVPATENLFDFYARQGFSTKFFRRVVSFDMNDILSNNSIEEIPLNDIEKFYALREKHFACGGFFVRWDKEALRYTLSENRISGGEIFYFTNKEDEGYVIVELVANKIILKEIALSPALANAALSFFKNKYSSYTQIQCRLSMDSLLWRELGTIEPVAMLKWFSEYPSLDTSKAYINLLKD